MKDELKIAVFASGKGSNFEAIQTAIEKGTITGARVVVVISNNPDAGALRIARDHNIPALHISRSRFDNDEAFENQLLGSLGNHNVNFIALAGYMKKIPSSVISRYRNRIINIHPALLPRFGGKGMYGEHVHRAVIASGDKTSGATVHVVDEIYDHGAIVLQKTVPVHPDDTPESLAARVLKIEHEIYPEAIRLFAGGKVTINDNRLSILS